MLRFNSNIWLRIAGLWMLLLPIYAQAQVNMYSLEIGAHVGGGYYVGELAPHVFMTTTEAYGAHIRYKMNDRWAFKIQGIRQRVMWEEQNINNPIWNTDITVDFNFFDFGQRDFDIYQVSPFIFAGIGCSIYKTTDAPTASPYIPFGVGLKWKFHDRMQLQLAWQHNAHILWNGDCLEGDKQRYPTGQKDKRNFLNNDLTSSFTLCLVVEFAKHHCGNKNIDY